MEAPRAVIANNGSIPTSMTTARSYIERALDAIAPLADNDGTVALRGAAHHLLDSLPATG